MNFLFQISLLPFLFLVHQGHVKKQDKTKKFTNNKKLHDLELETSYLTDQKAEVKNFGELSTGFRVLTQSSVLLPLYHTDAKLNPSNHKSYNKKFFDCQREIN